MTDVDPVRTRAGAPSTTEPERSGWTGWVVFAAGGVGVLAGNLIARVLGVARPGSARC
jgi:hypothetical protein